MRVTRKLQDNRIAIFAVTVTSRHITAIDNVMTEDVTADLSKNGNPDLIGGQYGDVISLSDNIFMFSHRTIGNHDNVYEGEVVSSACGVRPCVIKFARISEQNVKEAEILTKLGSQTNIIAIIQSGTYCDVFEDRFYIALDKCHNENLRQYLANRKKAGIEFDLNQAIDFAKQIIVGVMYIHDNNVIHLDLKPSNILISQNLTLIKIADFGLSIIVKSPKSKVFHKRQFGTNGYRPVESFGNGEVSMRTDIFSLGTVLQHLLSNGRDVFGCDEHVFIHNVLNDVNNTSGLLVDNPITTEHLIKCMVSQERCRRPNIWEVSDHPCWSGKEVECDFEYFDDDELDDQSSDDMDNEIKEIASPTDIEREKSFMKRMREMGFRRKPTIVVFDGKSKHLHRFDVAKRSMTQMHRYQKHNFLAALTFGEYIYAFNIDRLIPFNLNYQRFVDRLEYCDVTAKWEKMSWPDQNEGEGTPRITASSDGIIMVGGLRTTSVFKYNHYLNQWDVLPERPTSSSYPAVVYSNGFLFCIGGRYEKYEPSNRVDRLDLATKKWMRISNMNTRLIFPIAAACGQHIYVIGHKDDNDSTTKIMEKYDPTTDRWTKLKPTNSNIRMDLVCNAFAIDGDLYIVDHHQILKYDVTMNELSIVASYRKMHFQTAVVVNMSA